MNPCLECSKPSLNPKFCSRSCSAAHHNRLSPKRHLTKMCKTCSKPIRTSRTFCSVACYPKKDRKIKDGYERIRSFRTRMKQQAVDYMGGKCSSCGYDRCIQALEFHHLDADKKDFNISGKIRSWVALEEELKKCVMLCANCHREVHAGLRRVVA